MKKLLAIVLTLALTLTLFGCSGGSSSEDSSAPSGKGEKLKIGIIQIMEHPSLDEIRTAFLNEMAALGYDENKVEYDYQNAQGEGANVTSICQKFVHL